MSKIAIHALIIFLFGFAIGHYFTKLSMVKTPQSFASLDYLGGGGDFKKSGVGGAW